MNTETKTDSTKKWEVGQPIELGHARRVLETIDAGLISGLGKPELGQMCVEQCVCYALGLPDSDDPVCVSRAVRAYKISLNDRQWSSDAARSKGLRRLGIAQLGSNVIDDQDFKRRLATKIIQRIVPIALRAAGSLAKEPHKAALESAALKCESEGSQESAQEARRVAKSAYAAAAAYAAADAAYAAADAAYAAYTYAYAADAAYAYAYAAYAAADADAKKIRRDEIYTLAANLGVDVLREMNAPGIALMDELIPA